ncbi:MAG: hypothetical protein EBU90_15490, partial [Proteobacteria bacterium]|nr:hypothetical protein [Pseudomonadota bacterium]
VTQEQEKAYTLVLAGIDFANAIKGLLKEKEPSLFIRIMSFGVSDDISAPNAIRNAIKIQAQRNLEDFAQWYINKQVQHFITEINPHNLPLTAQQEKDIRAKEAFFTKALKPVVRLVSGKSTRLEKIGLWLATKFANILQKIRSKSGGEPIDTRWQTNLKKEALIFASKRMEELARTTLQVAGDMVNAAGQGLIEGGVALGTAVKDFAQTQGELAVDAANAAGRQSAVLGAALGAAVIDFGKTTVELGQGVYDGATEMAVNFAKNMSLESMKNIAKKMASSLKTYVSSSEDVEESEQFFETSEFSLKDLENFLNESIIKKMQNSQDEDYAKIIEDALTRFETRLSKERNMSQEGIEIIFEALSKEMDYAVLRQMNPREFSKLTPELKLAVTQAWKNAPEEELIQISEEYYNFFPEEVLATIKNTLIEKNKINMDFDYINKLAALSLLDKQEAATVDPLKDQRKSAENTARESINAKEKQAMKAAEYLQEPMEPLKNHDVIEQESANPTFRQRSDSTASINSVYEDAPGQSLGDIQKQEALEKKSKEEQKKKEEAVHEVKPSEHTAVEVHGL